MTLREKIVEAVALLQQAEEALAWALPRSPEAAASMVRESAPWRARSRAVRAALAEEDAPASPPRSEPPEPVRMPRMPDGRVIVSTDPLTVEQGPRSEPSRACSTCAHEEQDDEAPPCRTCRPSEGDAHGWKPRAPAAEVSAEPAPHVWAKSSGTANVRCDRCELTLLELAARRDRTGANPLHCTGRASSPGAAERKP
jgi:hypothetical protein